MRILKILCTQASNDDHDPDFMDIATQRYFDNVDANKTLWSGFWPVSMSAQSNTPSGGNLPISPIRLKI